MHQFSCQSNLCMFDLMTKFNLYKIFRSSYLTMAHEHSSGNSWLIDKPRALAYPHIYSHSTSPHILVAQVLQDGLLANVQDRLTHVASVELAAILSWLQDDSTSDAPDGRFLNHGSTFSSRCAYTLFSPDSDVDDNTGYI